MHKVGDCEILCHIALLGIQNPGESQRGITQPSEYPAHNNLLRFEPHPAIRSVQLMTSNERDETAVQ